MHPIPLDVQCNIPAVTYNGSIHQKLHILSNVRHADHFLMDTGTYPDNNIFLSFLRCPYILDLPDFPAIYHAIFFRLLCGYKQFLHPFCISSFYFKKSLLIS